MLYVSSDPGIPVHGHKGASVHVRALVRALHGLGAQVTVASPRLETGEAELPQDVRAEPIPAVPPDRVADHEALKAAQVAALASIAERVEPDLIYERYSLHGVAGARVARASGIPLLLEVNAPLRQEAQRYRSLPDPDGARADEAEAMAAAQRIFVVSEELAQWLAGQGVPASRIDVTPNAFPSPVIAKPRPTPGAERAVVVGFAGGLRPWHGVEVLLEGFELALARGANLRLEIAGDGPGAELLGRGAWPALRFRWYGHVAHAAMGPLLAGWDIGVAPFRGFPGFYFSPLKLGEYMAAGLCPVASDLPPLRALLDGERCGVLVTPDDPAALADALVALDDDRARLAQVAARALSRAAAGPTWSDVARRVLAAA